MRPLNLTDYLLLRIASALTKKDAETLYQGYEAQRAKTERNGAEVSEEDVLAIYAAYPTRDPSNKNRSLGKCDKDKQRIRLLLRKYTKDQLLEAINAEIMENVSNGKWLRNFSTFLNNIPDVEGDPEKKESFWQ